MKVTDDEMERAVMFLASSDENYARAKSYFNGLDRQTKTIKAMAFIRSAEKTAAGKEQEAYVSPAYRAHLEKMESAELEYLTLQEQRNTSIVMIDVWRSLNSARAKGVL